MRDFPPVEPVDRPERLSQTLLRHFDRCPRSAYLYVKHDGGAPSHAMHRGSAFHEFAARAVNHCVEHGEPQLPGQVAKDILAEVLADPRFVMPAEEAARLRVQAWHFAEGFKVNPDRVLAVERKFVLDVGGHTVSGKVDYAELSEDGRTATVIDFKTSYRMASESELAEPAADVGGSPRVAPKTFQLLFYTLLLAYGRPVRGKARPGVAGPGEDEVFDPPVGGRINTFILHEAYPQYLFDDGIGMSPPLTVIRPELPDHLAWLEGLVSRAAEAFDGWRFPAVPGSHCPECPARRECPIPEQALMNVDTPEDLADFAASYYQIQASLKLDWAEIKAGVDQHGPVPLGDEILEYVPQERRKTDVEGMAAAARRAAEFGEPFDPGDYIKRTTSTALRKRKVDT